MAPIISVSHGASVYPSSGTAQDFSNPVIYTVTPLSGAPQEWTVTVFFIPVTGINLDPQSLTLEIGESTPISAAVTPQNATNKKISWNSSNPQVVEVDQLGNITALGCGTATITATSESGGFSDHCQVTVEIAGFKRNLVSGWNTLSVPLKLRLEQNTLGQILDTAKVDLIYTYDPINGQWVEQAGDLTVHPMDALYVKVKNGMENEVEMFPYEDLSIAYEKELQRGWNLFGPSLDLGSPEGYKMSGADYLKSLDGRYSLVISQPVGSQKGWVYVQGNSDSPYLYAGSGYWVYLLEDKNLAGAGFTPVERIYQVTPEPDSIQPQSDSSDTGVPELPAAFFGSVKYANGEPVHSGTIELVVDGQVRAAKEFSGGYYGLSLGQRLIVEKIYLDYAQGIQFLVNGQEASYQEVFDPSTASGKLIELHLTIDNTLPADLYYLSLAVTDPDVVELIFSQNISNNLATEEALKKAISFSPDGLEFNPLTDQDTIQIVEQRLIISFAQALSGNSNVIKINAQALKNQEGDTLYQEVITAPFASQPVDECFIATAAFGSKFDWPVALLRQFRDQCLLSNQLGSILVNYYYQKSPAIAAIIADHSLLKLAVRIMLIPFIGAAYLALHYQWALLLILLFMTRRRFVRLICP